MTPAHCDRAQNRLPIHLPELLQLNAAGAPVQGLPGTGSLGSVSNPMEKINILITEDHALLRGALALLLNSDPRFEVVGEAGSGPEALELAPRLRPRVVIMDIKLPGLNGMEVAGQLRKLLPGTRVLMLSLHTQAAIARQALQKGALGYVTKTSPWSELITALVEISQGRRYICQELRDSFSEEVLRGGQKAQGIDALTPRELEVIDLLKRGASSREIAGALQVSAKTVEAHRYNILKKLQLKNTMALVEYIHTHGLD